MNGILSSKDDTIIKCKKCGAVYHTQCVSSLAHHRCHVVYPGETTPEKAALLRSRCDLRGRRVLFFDDSTDEGRVIRRRWSSKEKAERWEVRRRDGSRTRELLNEDRHRPYALCTDVVWVRQFNQWWPALRFGLRSGDHFVRSFDGKRIESSRVRPFISHTKTIDDLMHACDTDGDSEDALLKSTASLTNTLVKHHQEMRPHAEKRILARWKDALRRAYVELVIQRGVQTLSRKVRTKTMCDKTQPKTTSQSIKRDRSQICVSPPDVMIRSDRTTTKKRNRKRVRSQICVSPPKTMIRSDREEAENQYLPLSSALRRMMTSLPSSSRDRRTWQRTARVFVDVNKPDAKSKTITLSPTLIIASEMKRAILRMLRVEVTEDMYERTRLYEVSCAKRLILDPITRQDSCVLVPDTRMLSDVFFKLGYVPSILVLHD